MEDFDKKENEELVERFAQMIHNGTLDYFDSTEIEIIIDELMSDFDLELANEAIEYAIKTFPFNSIFRILKVKKLILEFALEDAEKELSRFEELFPLTSQFYLEKALLARITGKDINSLELLQKAFDLDSDNPEIHFSLAYEYIKNRDINKALKYAKLAISADDFFDEQLFMLSFLFEESGHYEEARQFFSALTEDFPLNKGAWFGLALAYSGLNDFEKSIEANLYVLSIDDELPTVYYNIGNSYFELAEYETAEKYYIKTLEFDPEDTLSLTAIGNCYTFKNMPSVALEYYQKAFRINENDLDTILGLLGTLIELGKKK